MGEAPGRGLPAPPPPLSSATRWFDSWWAVNACSEKGLEGARCRKSNDCAVGFKCESLKIGKDLQKVGVALAAVLLTVATGTRHAYACARPNANVRADSGDFMSGPMHTR